MTAALVSLAIIAALLVLAAIAWRRSRLSHDDLDDDWFADAAVAWDAEAAAWHARVRRAEIALRVRDRLGPAGDGEHEYAAVLAEVERLVVA